MGHKSNAYPHALLPSDNPGQAAKNSHLEKSADLTLIAYRWHRTLKSLLSRLTAPVKRKIITFLAGKLLEEGTVLSWGGIQIRAQLPFAPALLCEAGGSLSN